MNQEEALLALSFHSGRNTNINDPRWENGFLPSLRKFDGKLNENSFIEIMECLKALTKMFESNKVDKNLMADLYTIFYYTNLWLGKGGMLENIDDESRKRLNIWLQIYSYAFLLLLDYTDQSCKEAFYEYEDYLNVYTNYD